MSPWLSDVFLSSQSDARLVSLARAGHDRAFVAIVERYRRQLYALARRLSSDGRAEDIVQQAFLSAFTALRSGADVQHLRGWLHQILRNAAIRAAGTGRMEAELDPASISTGQLEDAVDQRMLAFSALSEVARLPERQRDALVGTAIHGRSRAEVATSMGLSEGAVRQLVHRARATVRGAVTAITPYPMAEWLTGLRSVPGGSRVAEIMLGACSASAGGLALKLGAVVVSGVAATSVVSSQLQRHSSRPAAMTSHRVVSAASIGPAGGTRAGGYSIPRPTYAVLVLLTRSARHDSSTISVAPHGGVQRARGTQGPGSGGGSPRSAGERTTSGAADGRGASVKGGSSPGRTGDDGQDGGRDGQSQGTSGVGSTQGRGAEEQSSGGSGGGHDGDTSSGGGRVGGSGDGLSASAGPVSGGGGPSGAMASAGDSADAGGGAGKDAGGSRSANDSGLAGSLASDSAGVSPSHAGGSSQGG